MGEVRRFVFNGVGGGQIRVAYAKSHLTALGAAARIQKRKPERLAFRADELCYFTSPDLLVRDPFRSRPTPRIAGITGGELPCTDVTS